MLPVIRELKRRKVHFDVVATGQHTDLMAGTGLKPDYFLGLPSQNTPDEYVAECAKMLRGFHGKPHIHTVLVQGDTASALAGARWAVEAGLAVGHIEAGLRSGNLQDPWPEEGYRVEIDRLATHRFCPTTANLNNLMAEPDWAHHTEHGRFSHVTGNTIIDQLRYMGVKRTRGQHVLVTLHRRESFGAPLREILRALAGAANAHPTVPFCFPVHPNPEVRQAVREAQLPPNVILGGPLAYKEFLEFLSGARAVVTDSGGVVEEACWLGVPTVIARDTTERGEAVGVTARLAGRVASQIWDSVDWALGARVEPSTAFGNGTAGVQIVAALIP